jgi:hypothetical protein
VGAVCFRFPGRPQQACVRGDSPLRAALRAPSRRGRRSYILSDVPCLSRGRGCRHAPTGDGGLLFLYMVCAAVFWQATGLVAQLHRLEQKEVKWICADYACVAILDTKQR